MTMPTDTSKETSKRDDYVTRFFGGPPLSVIFRLVLLSILVGVILKAFGFDPWHIIDSLQRLLGFRAVRDLWRFLVLGAVIVVPIWLVLRLARARGK